MAGMASGLVMATLLLTELWFAVRRVRRHAVPTDLAITDEDCRRAAVDASDFTGALTRAQRRQVRKAVMAGNAVDDPALAPATVSVAYATWMKARVSVARPSWIAGLAVVFWGSVAASRLITDGRSWWQVSNVVIVVASVWLLPEIVSGPLRRADRAQRAQGLNLALMGRGSS